MMECSALCCKRPSSSPINVGRRHAVCVWQRPDLGSSCRKFQIRAPVKPHLQISWATSKAADAAEDWPEEGYKAITYDAGVGTQFFNREYELQYINDVLDEEPSGPILLLGPLDCGKTAFINELKKQDTSRSFLHVHCGNVTSSSLMAQALRKQAMQFPPWRDAAFVVSVVLSFSDSQPWMLKIVAPIREWLLKNARDLSSQQILADKFMEEIFPENKANDLSYVLRQYQFLFENTPAGGKKPVIILDEINRLKTWSKPDEEEMKLNFMFKLFKYFCTTQNSAHFIMATSDSGMESWLRSRGMPGTTRRDEVLGDLTHEEALRYVVGDGKEWPGLISMSEDIPALHQKDWGMVWAVCGGNMYQLRECVSEAGNSKDWVEAVEMIRAAPVREVTNAWFGNRTNAKYTREHYRTAVGLIAASPYHAVQKYVLQTELEKQYPNLKEFGLDGAQVLESMIEYTVLSMRPYSDLAKDMPREVFIHKDEKGVEMMNRVVVMPTPVHLYTALNMVRKEKIKKLK